MTTDELPAPPARRIIRSRQFGDLAKLIAKVADSGPDTARLRFFVSPLASGACFGDETGETGTRCATGNGCNASAAPATVSQYGCITVNSGFTSHCDITWRPHGRARMTWEGDAATLASPETGLLHSCCPSNRRSVCNGSSAGMRRMTAMRRPQVVADHLCACRRSF